MITNKIIKTLFPILLITGTTVGAQVSTDAVIVPNIFSYDEAGNQIYRGKPITVIGQQSEEEPQGIVATNDEEEKFWNEVRIYPVPVKDILTIDWTDKVDGLIDNVSIYQQSSIHWKFQQQNIPDLNRKVEINMSTYYMGVYVLTFQLKDGRSISRNITKL